LGLQFARKRGLTRLLQASAEALPVRSGTVDLLVCLDVLYHRGILDDRAALAECFRVLKSGGTAVITDSALEWLRGPHDEAVHARKRYRLDEIADLVGGSGLRIVRQSYVNTLLFVPMAGYRLLRRWRPGRASGSDVLALPRPIQMILGGIMRLERSLLGWMDLPIGTSVVVVARKP
jgi:SAM-dependent methyltransferase